MIASLVPLCSDNITTITLLYLWIVVILVMLSRLDFSVMLLMVMILTSNSIIGFISIELMFVVVLVSI